MQAARDRQKSYADLRRKEPVEIVDREVKRLKRSQIPLVQVRWNSKRDPEFTWDARINFGRNTHISSQRSHCRQVSRLKA
nr:putative reverse transcriptase domain-containing protein [Tanacetum cinerariifolium]